MSHLAYVDTSGRQLGSLFPAPTPLVPAGSAGVYDPWAGLAAGVFEYFNSREQRKLAESYLARGQTPPHNIPNTAPHYLPQGQVQMPPSVQAAASWAPWLLGGVALAVLVSATRRRR